ACSQQGGRRPPWPADTDQPHLAAILPVAPEIIQEQRGIFCLITPPGIQKERTMYIVARSEAGRVADNIGFDTGAQEQRPLMWQRVCTMRQALLGGRIGHSSLSR